MNDNKLSALKMTQLLEWTYERVLDGPPGMQSAVEMAEDYMKKGGSKYEQANSLIRWQNTKAAASGAVTGLGGALTLPIAIPANIASVLYIQLRMVAAIAHIGGHDLRDDRVKTAVYLALVSKTASEVGKTLAIELGKRFAVQAIKKVPGRVLIQINKQVGFRLFTKFGQRGVVNLGKSVPLVGAVIGGSVDLYITNKVGNVARDLFIGQDEEILDA